MDSVTAPSASLTYGKSLVYPVLNMVAEGRGKRGGVRVIYFHVSKDHHCRLLLIYPKNAQGDLTAAEKKTLRKLNDNW